MPRRRVRAPSSGVRIGPMNSHPKDTGFELPVPAVSADWLAANVGRPGLVVLDGSWYLPGSGRDPAREFVERRIPGARFFDIDRCSDPAAELPHTIPPPEHFRKCAEEVGVSDESSVVVYDGSGVNLSAARVWWTFRYFGVRTVAVLDGGLHGWVVAGHPTESGAPIRTLEAPAPFTPVPQPHLIRSATDVLRAIGAPGTQIVDMRPPGPIRGDRAGTEGGTPIRPRSRKQECSLHGPLGPRYRPVGQRGGARTAAHGRGSGSGQGACGNMRFRNERLCLRVEPGSRGIP